MGEYAYEALRVAILGGQKRGLGRPILVMDQEICTKCGGNKLTATRNHTICDVSNERHILNGISSRDNETMTLNEYDIDEILDLTRHEHPEIEPYAQFLYDWKETVNSNSDGWPYWKAGRNAADKLANLLEGVKTARFGRGEIPTEAQLKKALAPIRAAATRHGLTSPELREPGSAPSMR